MTIPAVNALSFNLYIQQMGIMAVVQTVETAGVWGFVDAAAQGMLPSMLNYAELRCARDLDTLSSQSSNTYPLIAGANVLSLPVNDFLTVQTIEIGTGTGTAFQPLAPPLLPTSKEFIQNCYGGLSSSGMPQYYALYGDAFGGDQNTNTNILLGPPPNFAFAIRVSGTARAPSLYQNAVSGIADTDYTYLSQWYPDLLVMASMIYVTMFQRNFGPVGDSPEMGMTYEKQYQALRIGAIQEENRRKLMGSGWSAYSTPVSATPTR